MALNSESGEVTLTSDLSDITEDTTLQLTAMAKDHGQPPLNSTGQCGEICCHLLKGKLSVLTCFYAAAVVVNLRVVSLVENVAFQSSSYNFSLLENQPAGVLVGRVFASAGSNIYKVTYALKTHADLFSVDANGAIMTTAQLDREQQEWYILEVEAVDTRSPPTSATAVVRPVKCSCFNNDILCLKNAC